MQQTRQRLFWLLLPIGYFLFFFTPALAQEGIGIGTEDVNADAILEIDSNTEGLLIPRMSTAQRNAVGASSEGLVVYDTNYDAFFYWDNSPGLWRKLIASEADLDVELGSNNLSANVITSTRFEGLGVVPLGAIIMWSGSTVPSDYQLCNGSSRNGYTTPNLIGQFIVGGATGGSGGGTNSSSTTEISYIETPAYTINGTTCQTQRYRYSFSYTETCDFPGEPLTIVTINVNNVVANSCAAAQSQHMNPLPDCGHSNFSSCTTSNNPNYYRTNPACFNSSVNVVNAVTGTENRPQYYRLAFIMRVE